jgi:hypothetical protein
MARKYIVPVTEKDKSGNLVVGSHNGPITLHRTNSEKTTILEVMADNTVMALHGNRLKVKEAGRAVWFVEIQANLKEVQRFIRPKYYLR